MQTLPSLTAVKATFPLTLRISLGYGLCKNVFHYVIYTSHTPIVGNCQELEKRKRGVWNSVNQFV